jgi:hypothetical protein
MAQDMLQSPAQRFELTKFFAGRTVAWGIFEDRFGRLRRRFNVEMRGAWNGSQFQLDEAFTYDTGETETRTWMVTPGSDGRFTATCADCIGVASGTCDADSIRMCYRLRLTISGRDMAVTFDDRIYRMGEELAVNRATMSKLGVVLGELALFFKREPG